MYNITSVTFHGVVGVKEDNTVVTEQELLQRNVDAYVSAIIVMKMFHKDVWGDDREDRSTSLSVLYNLDPNCPKLLLCDDPDNPTKAGECVAHKINHRSFKWFHEACEKWTEGYEL